VSQTDLSRRNLLTLSVLVIASRSAPTVLSRRLLPGPFPRLVRMPLPTSAADIQAQGGDTRNAHQFRAPFPVSHAGLSWHGAPDADIETRYAGPNKKWSQWEPFWLSADMSVDTNLTNSKDTSSSRFFSALLQTEQALEFQVRVLSGLVSRMEISLIDAQSNSPSPAIPKGDALPAPSIITRAMWKADESLRAKNPSHAPIERFILHHTATSNKDNNPEATVRAIYAYHTETREWSDIGYNFLIDAKGHVYEGRWARDYKKEELHDGEDQAHQGVIGAHAKNHNTGSCGIALLGNFEKAVPSAAGIAALNTLLAWKNAGHKLNPRSIHKNLPRIMGHKDVGSTLCPGKRFFALLPAIRKETEKIILASQLENPGYRVILRSGKAQNFGTAATTTLATHTPQDNPPHSSASTPIVSAMESATGYWLAAKHGEVLAFGDAKFYGSMGGKHLNKPITAIAPTPTNKGYWLAAQDGGIFAFGDARLHKAKTADHHTLSRIVTMRASIGGRGYYLLSSEGEIHTFGDAKFHGSLTPPTDENRDDPAVALVLLLPQSVSSLLDSHRKNDTFR